MRVKRARMTLVVAPKSALAIWDKEAKNFLPKFVKTVRVIKLHGGDQKSRQKIIRNAWRDAEESSEDYSQCLEGRLAGKALPNYFVLGSRLCRKNHQNFPSTKRTSLGLRFFRRSP